MSACAGGGEPGGDRFTRRQAPCEVGAPRALGRVRSNASQPQEKR